MVEEDKYEVLEKIGHGSFGVIHKVRRRLDGYILCRKSISYSRMTPKEREQLQAELSILKELRHPNIVAYYEREHIKASQDLHLYMEYCGNGDLGRIIRNLKSKNQLAEEEFVWSIFAQLVTALYRCHYGEDAPEVGRNVLGLGNDAKPRKHSQYMILHRDLKPENVFLGTDNSVKLGDFGLSKILQSHDFASTYVGTPFYMSPEICAAERYTLFSDIWSLGCIIYELCTKEPPFNARTHFELIQKIKLGKVAPIPSVYSPELSSVIKTCLQVNPNNRPDTVHLLNLPIVKLMRKEQEVVHLGHQLKAEKELASRTAKEYNEKISRLQAEKEAMRSEIDATVRREWEVKARLEIDRQVGLEVERLHKAFEEEVAKRVAQEVEQRMANLTPEQVAHLLPSNQSSDSPFVRSSTPTHDHSCATASSLNEPSEFPSQTDLSELSLESPTAAKKAMPPMKRLARTPFTRAQTMFAGQLGSPMDVQMASPTPAPMSIAGLSLSPRRNGLQAANPPAPKRNIFAEHAAGKLEDFENFEMPPSPSEYPSPGSDRDLLSDDDEVILPSPTRAKSALAGPIASTDADPFKVLATGAQQLQAGQGKQRALKPLNGRLASAPNLFAANVAANGAAKVRPASTVPVIAVSPSRRKSKIPPPETSGSPVHHRKPAPLNLNMNLARDTSNGSSGGLKSKKGNEEMIRTAMRNHLIQGRTLVELAQARNRPPSNVGDRTSRGSSASDTAAPSTEEKKGAAPATRDIGYAAKVAEWDPEKDEMPSPFLVRARGVRAGFR